MKNKVYSIENQDGLNFSVQKTLPCAITYKGKERLPEQITFLFGEIDPESDLTEDNNLVCSISKEEAVNLAIRLLKLSTERVPENGLAFHNFSRHDFSILHAKKMAYILMNRFSKSGIWRQTILRKMEPSPYV